MQASLVGLDLDKTYLVGVSGGCDSMALLDMLYQAHYRLVVAHVNYKMRASADLDQALVAAYCQARNIPFCVQIRDQEPRGNFQDWARHYRYGFFRTVYSQHACDALLIAHHRQDFLETYLMKQERFSRSEHVGIASVSFIKNMRVLRPLLSFYKQDLIAYCQQHHITYGIDETNFDARYRRNAIRMQQVDPLSKKELEELYQQALLEQKKQEEFFSKVDVLYRQLVVDNSFDFAQLKQREPSFQQQFLYQFITANNIKPKQTITASFLTNLLASLHSDKPNITIPLGAYQLVKSYDRVTLMKPEKNVDYSYEINDTMPYQTPYFIYQDESGEEFSVSQADFPLTIRNYRTNDQIKIGQHRVLLRRFFINKKIPLYLRKKIPIVCNQAQEIIFIPALYQNKDGNLLQTSRIVVKLRALL